MTESLIYKAKQVLVIFILNAPLYSQW